MRACGLLWTTKGDFFCSFFFFLFKLMLRHLSYVRSSEEDEELGLQDMSVGENHTSAAAASAADSHPGS